MEILKAPLLREIKPKQNQSIARTLKFPSCNPDKINMINRGIILRGIILVSFLYALTASARDIPSFDKASQTLITTQEARTACKPKKCTQEDSEKLDKNLLEAFRNYHSSILIENTQKSPEQELIQIDC